MNNVDYDKKLFTSDSYGNLCPASDKTYKGFKIDIGLSHVKVWDKSDNFVSEYPDEKSAKQAIDGMTKSMQWKIIQTSDNEIEWQKDDSGIYSLITWNPSDNVRCDLMSDNHEPIVTFVGKSDNVRKAICKFCSDNQIHLSDQHASYIGRELTRAEFETTSYNQD